VLFTACGAANSNIDLKNDPIAKEKFFVKEIGAIRE